MKKLGLTVLATIGLASAAVTAQAQAWQSINQRQAELDRRIAQGQRSGALTPNEVNQLRAEFRQIAAIEERFRRTGGGLDNRERADLNMRFSALSARVYVNRVDRDYVSHWQSIDVRKRTLQDRIDRGARTGLLTRGEATRLRADLNGLSRLEADYHRSGWGLTIDERRDLDRRFTALGAQVRAERSDRQGRR
jgi:hypothetical protein